MEYDLNGAEFLLKQVRAALTVSATRDVPPVAAYCASLEGSRNALWAVREAANVGRSGGRDSDATPASSSRSPGIPSDDRHVPKEKGAGLKGILKGVGKLLQDKLQDLLEDPFLDPLLASGTARDSPQASARYPKRGEIPGEEALRFALEDSEDYQVSAGYYPPPGTRRQRSRGEGTTENSEKKKTTGRRRSSRRGGRGQSLPEMSPVIEESSPQKDSRALSRRASPMKPADLDRTMNPNHKYMTSTPSRPQSDADLESLWVGESAWTEGDAMWADTRDDEKQGAWLTALHGAGGGMLRGEEISQPELTSQLHTPPGLKPVVITSNTNTNQSGTAVRESPSARTPVSDSGSDVGCDLDGYKDLISKYATVGVGDSPGAVDEYFSDGNASTPSATPRAGGMGDSESKQATFLSPENKEISAENKKPPTPKLDDVSVRDLLFSTRSGGDARAPESDSWKASTAAYDPSTSGRSAKRSETELKKELKKGVARIEKSSESLAVSSRLAADANDAGEALLASLRGQTEQLSKNATELKDVGHDMEKNEKLMNDMSSWTRLGAKPQRRPWG